jgi:hypothetical protein
MLEKDVVKSVFETFADFSYALKRWVGSRVFRSKILECVTRGFIIEHTQELCVGIKQLSGNRIGNAVALYRSCQNLKRCQSHEIPDVLKQFELYTIIVGGNLAL